MPHPYITPTKPMPRCRGAALPRISLDFCQNTWSFQYFLVSLQS